MAISTKYTYLMKKASGANEYTKLIDIKEFPDLGSSPNMIETTTLSDNAQTFIAGIIQMGDGLAFTANYTATDYGTLKALEDQELDYALWFGATGTGSSATPDGHNGKFSFKGQLTATLNGGGVDEVVGMTVTIAPSTVISFNNGT